MFNGNKFILYSAGETKTMLCFDGCATHLGCTVTLRGGTQSELKRVRISTVINIACMGFTLTKNHELSMMLFHTAEESDEVDGLCFLSLQTGDLLLYGRVCSTGQ